MSLLAKIKNLNKVLILFLFIYVISSATAQVRPSVVYDSLFRQIQGEALFSDSKTFPDCDAKIAPALIMTQYGLHRYDKDFSLSGFFDRYFNKPVDFTSGFKSDTSMTTEEHIRKLWPVLVRQPGKAHPWSSLIPLPHPFVVPGGRFREVYYWDSYFTMLGLVKSGRTDLMKDMLDNFRYLIDTIGFIPNGNRTYYLGRSQPPFFALMVRLWGDLNGKSAMEEYLPALIKEYNFWMEGADRLKKPGDSFQRVVKLDNNVILNRYWDNIPEPRPEAYKEDVKTALASGRDLANVYRDLRATAESGWDFCSRWFSDHQHLKTIMTTQIVPVDLNSLMYNLEITISEIYGLEGNIQQSAYYNMLAERRRSAINLYCFNTVKGFYSDYNLDTKKVSDNISLAAAYPLFMKAAPEKQAVSTIKKMLDQLDKPGGLVATTFDTGEQWDYPNGWPPLEYIGIMAMDHYGYSKDARRIARKWLDLNSRVYHQTGKMMEKYDVININASAGGGEYTLQDGFGWTNGVYLALKDYTSK